MKRISQILACLLLTGMVAQAPLVADTGQPAATETHRTASHAGAHNQADPQKELGKQLSPWTVVPFVIILLAIAILPLVIPHLWESNLVKAVISTLLALIMGAYLATLGHVGIEVIVETLKEYYAFITLLIALFTISGGIFIEGDLKATPLTNTIILGIGSVIASFIGTTGASVLLIRPLIRTNKERRKTTHVFVFFILLVSNVGGVLLPLGDPPLFLGYLYGVPFFWTLIKLWPIWLTAVATLLIVFFLWDTIAYKKEALADIRKDDEHQTPIRIQGAHNFLLILGVLLAVVFLKDYQTDHGMLALSWLQQPVMMALALLSFSLDYMDRTRKRKKHEEDLIERIKTEGRVDVTTLRSLSHYHPITPRDRNHFGFAPIIEVAALFIGIFITMIPALCILKARGGETGVTQPWQFYWITGGLSSFLDNAPSYATFFALGQGLTSSMGAAAGEVVQATTGAISESILVGISVGAVFFGANTYIGNAPNFMVKAMCEEAKIRMPSFFGYMAYTTLILGPVLALIAAIYL